MLHTSRPNRLERFLEKYCWYLLFLGTMTILTVSLIHFGQAVFVLRDANSMGATALLALKNAMNLLGIHHTRWFMIVLLICSSTSAAYAAIMPVGKSRIFIFIPQHAILGIMVYGCMVASLHGHYLDSTPMPGMHILADQWPIMVLFIPHTIAIILRSWVRDEENEQSLGPHSSERVLSTRSVRRAVAEARRRFGLSAQRDPRGEG